MHSTVTALSSEARADLFCQNLEPNFPLGKRRDKWKNLALFIETKLPRSDEQKVYDLNRNETGLFRSITYDSGKKSVYIRLHRKDFPDSSHRSMFSSSGWSQDPEDDSRIKRTETYPVLIYDLSAPSLVICQTTESKPKVPHIFIEHCLSELDEAKMAEVD